MFCDFKRYQLNNLVHPPIYHIHITDIHLQNFTCSVWLYFKCILKKYIVGIEYYTYPWNTLGKYNSSIWRPHLYSQYLRGIGKISITDTERLLEDVSYLRELGFIKRRTFEKTFTFKDIIGEPSNSNRYSKSKTNNHD